MQSLAQWKESKAEEKRMAQASQPEQVQLTPFQHFLSSHLVTGTGMFLSKNMPPFAGYALAETIAGLINWLKPDVYWVQYANLRRVLGPQAEEDVLHRVTRRAFRHNARNLYKLWHLVARGTEVAHAAAHISPSAIRHLEQALRRGKGTVVAGTHTGNFDLGVLMIASLDVLKNVEFQVLGMAAPPTGGFGLMEQMRAQAGIVVLPSGIPALRRAITCLRGGGVVLAAVDRPLDGLKPQVEFFGRLAPLTTGHVRLALKTDAALLVAGAYQDPQGNDRIAIYPPLEMVRTGDPAEELRLNLRRVTDLVEEHIRARPEQWSMFVPVWPATTQQPSSPQAAQPAPTGRIEGGDC